MSSWLRSSIWWWTDGKIRNWEGGMLASTQDISLTNAFRADSGGPFYKWLQSVTKTHVINPNELAGTMKMARGGRKKPLPCTAHSRSQTEGKANYLDRAPITSCNQIPNSFHPPSIYLRQPPIKWLSDAELQSKRERMLCLSCHEKYLVGHLCKNRKLQVWAGDEDWEAWLNSWSRGSKGEKVSELSSNSHVRISIKKTMQTQGLLNGTEWPSLVAKALKISCRRDARTLQVSAT